MRLSINMTNAAFRGPLARDLGDVARAADQGGLDTLWVGDHLIQAEPGLDLEEPAVEAYTTLGFLAATTSRLRLGTMVSAVTFRPPALLVKAVTTLDVLSGGRAWFGVGAGYHETEAAMMGLPLPPAAERFALLDDTLRLALRMWSGDQSAFDGARVHLDRPIGSPLPLTRPHPPILVGGMGEKKTLRLVARYAQACNLPDIPDGGATIRHKLAVLAEHCAAEGTDFAAIEKTVSTRLGADETPEQFAERAAALAGLGVGHLVVIVRGPWTPAAVDRLAAAGRLLAGVPA